MQIPKAVITAAGRNQRTLPLQTVIDRDGKAKAVLDILIDEAVRAGVDEVAVVVAPGDEERFAEGVGTHAARITYIAQLEAFGYAHAVSCARAFVGDDAFLHLVGDHLYVSPNDHGCAQALVELAAAESCSVSAVQATRESQLHAFGAVAGRPVPGHADLYTVETVIEKPTPTEAEMRLLVPGLRAGHYLCFYGMHVLTPAVMSILAELPFGNATRKPTLSDALAVLATREKYLALEERARRYDLGDTYGLLTAQLALALSGQDRELVLAKLLEVLAQREMATARRAG